jgi:hypothetical protein
MFQAKAARFSVGSEVGVQWRVHAGIVPYRCGIATPYL